MGRALSLDLRRRVAAAAMGGESVRSVAVRFQVSAASAVRLGQKARAGTDLAPGRRGRPRVSLITAAADWLRSRLAEKPDLTMRALAAELSQQGTPVTHDTVWRFVRRQGLTPKKNTLIATGRDRPIVARFRQRWRAHQHRIDPDRLVFLDETWIRTDMTRLRGWCRAP